jgi:hypothetical protein
MPDTVRAKWRWNYIPDYHALSTQVLEQRLKDKFGNWKFYVEVSLSMFSLDSCLLSFSLMAAFLV